MSDSTVTLDPQPIPPITEAQAQAAARTVAAHALNAADAQMILSALGLLERGRIVAPPIPFDALTHFYDPKGDGRRS
jgi:hypothetical protein